MQPLGKAISSKQPPFYATALGPYMPINLPSVGHVQSKWRTDPRRSHKLNFVFVAKTTKAAPGDNKKRTRHAIEPRNPATPGPACSSYMQLAAATGTGPAHWPFGHLARHLSATDSGACILFTFCQKGSPSSRSFPVVSLSLVLC